jgi:hypothetical protein
VLGAGLLAYLLLLLPLPLATGAACPMVAGAAATACTGAEAWDAGAAPAGTCSHPESDIGAGGAAAASAAATPWP